MCECETAEDLLALDLSPVEHLVKRLRAQSQAWGPLARLGRALRAGVIARRRLSGLGGFAPSPSVPFTNSIYVVLRGSPGFGPCFTTSAARYFEVVGLPGGGFHRDSISHAFPTRAEAEAYLIGAEARWPQAEL